MVLKTLSKPKSAEVNAQERERNHKKQQS